MNDKDFAVSEDKSLEEIVRRIVEVAQPERIVLFGSAARGTPGPDSDVDLLVVKRGAHRRKLAGEIYMRLIGVGRWTWSWSRRKTSNASETLRHSSSSLRCARAK